MISYGWEGNKHFVDWARWLAALEDDDYDPECDPPPRLWLAHHVMNGRRQNPDTAVMCLLNAWDRGDCPDNWDATATWLATMRFPCSATSFEDAALAYLATLEKDDSRPTGPTDRRFAALLAGLAPVDGGS